MTNYTIIGLGRIGTSLGMAIRGRQGGKSRVIGYDADNNAQSLAHVWEQLITLSGILVRQSVTLI